VVVEIDFRSLTLAAIPSKDQPPLPVDADRMKACQIATQLFEVVAWWNAQVLICSRIVDHLELPEEPPLEIGRNVSRPHVLDEEGT
jgi:hypothetical protein